METVIKVASKLDWSSGGHITVECAGRSFAEFYRISRKVSEDGYDASWIHHHFDHKWISEGSNLQVAEEKEANEEDGNVPPSVDLFSLSEVELKEIDYYKVLNIPCRPNITPEDVKKAYRKACLKYHPDKTGRDEKDAVFLKVKAAFETLSTQKMAYDSTEMSFDDSIPSEKVYSTSEFFADFEPCFQRNLYFDSRLLTSTNSSKQSNKTKRSGRRKINTTKKQNVPSLGDMSTSIETVNLFYDYWVNYSSWRDFSLQAAKELETQEHLENAESRYEKRWYQKEIDRHAKKLKQQELYRITQLVELAMSVDPRLVKERKRLFEEKKRKQREREQEILVKKKKEEDAKLAEQKRVEDEKKQRAEEKLIREKEKKMLRKIKQQFKRFVSSAISELNENEFILEDEVETICSEMNRLVLTALNDELESKSASEIISIVKIRANNIKVALQEVGTKQCSDTPSFLTKMAQDADKGPSSTRTSSGTKKRVSFSKAEMTALAKAVKKFPAKGNRWDLIRNYVNNVCQSENLRTKEECIEAYNKFDKSGNPSQNSSISNDKHICATSDVWTFEQDQQLQNGLQKFPPTMDKNERWSSIANEVDGKSKRECVSRFKIIRNALKTKK